MRVFITGGAGFIGSATARSFLDDGHDVVILDSFEDTLYRRELKEQNLNGLPEATFIEGDIRDVAVLKSTMAGCDAVVHLAAVAGVRPSLEKPSHYYDVNVTGTSNVLQVGRDLGITRYAIASSSSVYGGNEKTPFAESDPVTSPVSPYAASKRSVELLSGTEQRLHGGDICCLRFFTVFGPRQRPEMAIHKFIRLMVNQETIPMFGDGTSGRDYTFIEDIVSGIRSALEKSRGFEIYNLGGDDVILLKDLIQTIGDVIGEEPKIEQLPMQKGDVFVTNADLTKSRAELGFDPKTSVREGIEKMWVWYQAVYG